MSIKLRIFATFASVAALLTLAGSIPAQTQKPQSSVPKNEQRSQRADQDAPPPEGPDGFGPGMGMGRGRGMGPGRMGRGFGMGKGQRRGMDQGRMRGQGGPGMMFLGLGLTDDQKTRIQSIMKGAKPTDAQREEMRSLMFAARAGLLTEAQQTRLKAIRGERKAKREANHTQVMAILTAEQKAKLEERRAMRMQRNRMDRGPAMRRGPMRRSFGEGMGPRRPMRRDE